LDKGTPREAPTPVEGPTTFLERGFFYIPQEKAFFSIDIGVGWVKLGRINEMAL
jgi:hypothetical protein